MNNSDENKSFSCVFNLNIEIEVISTTWHRIKCNLQDLILGKCNFVYPKKTAFKDCQEVIFFKVKVFPQLQDSHKKPRFQEVG